MTPFRRCSGREVATRSRQGRVIAFLSACAAIAGCTSLPETPRGWIDGGQGGTTPNSVGGNGGKGGASGGVGPASNGGDAGGMPGSSGGDGGLGAGGLSVATGSGGAAASGGAKPLGGASGAKGSGGLGGTMVGGGSGGVISSGGSNGSGGIGPGGTGATAAAGGTSAGGGGGTSAPVDLNFTLTSTSLPSVLENGSPVTFNVALTTTPSVPVVVTVSSSAPSSVRAQFATGSSTCTLATLADACTVTVTALDDANAINESATVTIADLSPPAGAPMRPVAARTVAVSTVDNDTQNLIVSAAGSMLMIHERAPNNTATFTVRLQAQPASTTTVTISPNPSAADGISISGPSLTSSALTFTAANFGTAQTVTVTGIPDNDLRTDPFSIRVTAPALGVPDQFVNVSEIDDDVQAIVISKTTGPGTCPGVGADFTGPLGTLNEGSATPLEFCVNLAYQPLSNVVLGMVATPTNLVGNPTSLSFTTVADTASGYNRPQIVKFLANSDNTSTGDQAAQVVLSSSSFAVTRNVAFVVKELNFQSLILTNFDGSALVSPLAVAMGTNLRIRLRLAFNPTSAVSVMCASDYDPPVSVSPFSYIFTNTTSQFVMVTAANGGYSTPVLATITCLSPSLAAQSFTVIVP